MEVPLYIEFTKVYILYLFPSEPGHNEDQRLVPFYSGYLKTNAIGNNWEQYWATITGKQLVLHSSEENLNSLKTMELTQNVQCKTAKRSSYDFRFTLVLSTHECCEFKCATAHGRRQWMTALERAGWGVGQGSNAGSKISEIVTKIRENQNKLEEIQHQQQVEKEQEKQRQEMELQQQQQQQQQPQIRAENEDFYEVIPAENNLQQQISSPPHHVPQPTPLQKRQQQQQNADISQDIYDDVSANDTSQQSLLTAEVSAVHRDTDELELTAKDKNQNQPLGNTNDCKDDYKMMKTNNNQQKQQLPPPPQHLPPLTPPQRRQKKQQSQTVGNDLENVDNFVSGNIPQQSLLPPPPQQLPPLTPPQKRHQLQQQQQQDSDNGNDTYDDFVTAGNIQKQQLPPPPQQLPPPTPPQERQEQLQLTQEQTPSNAEDIGQDVYELIPGDNGKQQNQEELYEIIPAEKNEPQHQQPPPAPAEPQLQQQQQKQKDERQNKQKKHKEKKNKRILPELQTKKQKKEKKKQKGNSDELEQKDQKENEKDKSKQQKQQQQQQQQQQQAELEQNEDTMEEQNESSWNFEEHVQVLGEVNSTDSIVNEEAQLELKEEGNDMCAAENKSEITCPDEQTAIGESNLTQGKLF